jgi:Tfp pilus assembly protein PilZ
MMTNASGRVAYDDLLDLDVAPANDVGDRQPRLRSLSRWAMCATINLDSEDSLYAGLSYDVSTGGVFVATIDTPPIGTRVDLMVSLPDGREHALSGVVRWIRDIELATEGLPPGCGIEWKGLPVDALRTLEQFAEVREPILWLPEAAQ